MGTSLFKFSRNFILLKEKLIQIGLISKYGQSCVALYD